jgi:hypothetical protein
MRFLKYLLVTIVGILIAIGALVWEGSTLETLLPIRAVPVVDFASLQRTSTPNQYLLCPEGMCVTDTDGQAPVFDMPAERLQGLWELMIKDEPRVQEVQRDLAAKQVDYVQRTRFFRFPDLVTVRFVPVSETQSTLAIYARSIYGMGDMGVNRERVLDWLTKLQAKTVASL